MRFMGSVSMFYLEMQEEDSSNNIDRKSNIPSNKGDCIVDMNGFLEQNKEKCRIQGMRIGKYIEDIVLWLIRN